MRLGRLNPHHAEQIFPLSLGNICTRAKNLRANDRAPVQGLFGKHARDASQVTADKRDKKLSRDKTGLVAELLP